MQEYRQDDSLRVICGVWRETSLFLASPEHRSPRRVPSYYLKSSLAPLDRSIGYFTRSSFLWWGVEVSELRENILFTGKQRAAVRPRRKAKSPFGTQGWFVVFILPNALGVMKAVFVKAGF